MTQPEAQNKRDDNDSIGKLEHDIKNAIERAKDGYIEEDDLKIFFERYMVFIENIKKYYDKLKIKDVNEDAEKHIKKACQLGKRLIFWNLLALFLFWADINIGSIDAQQSSGAVFGIVVSGLDKYEVMVGFLIFLTMLYVCLWWVILKTLVLLFYKNVSYRLKKELENCEKIWEFLTTHGHPETVQLDIDKTGQHLIDLTTSYKSLMTYVEDSFFIAGGVYLTMRTSLLASPDIEKHYELLFDLDLYILSFHAIIFVMPMIVYSYIKMRE